VPSAAAYLGIQTGTLRNWLSMRRLPYVKIGRLTRVSKRALDDFIAAHTIDAENE
jgi:excisionase family DNA binding protein